MSDIILLSNLPTPSTRVQEALEAAGLHTVDILTLDVLEIQRRTQLPIADVQNLVKDVVSALNLSIESKTAEERFLDFAFLTTGDENINELLGGGIPTGSLTEITGESGLGKSQLCLQLCIHVQLPRSLGGLDAGAIYIGTESSLATPRLSQIAESLSSRLTAALSPQNHSEDIDAALKTLTSHGDRILYFHCSDLETQEHIITYQLPVVLSRHRIGLIVLDSVTANYRAEFDHSQKPQSQYVQMAQRSKDLRKLAGILKGLAIEWNVAVVAVNQVTDAFKKLSQSANSSQEEELLSLEYQSKWFDGLIDEYGNEGTKKPALGLVWANLIASRIMLVRGIDGRTRIKVVFSPFAKPRSLLYAISTEAGIHAVETPGVTFGEEKDTEGNEDYNGDDEQIIYSGFDAKIDDVEFSDFDPEEI